MKKIIILILPFFITCCNNNINESTQILIKEFEHEMQLHGDFIELDNASLMTKQILIVDSLLIMENLNYNNHEYYFNVYNIKKNFGFLWAFGKQGRGPTEFNFPKLTGQYSIDEDGIKIWIIDSNIKIKQINLTKTLLNKNVSIEKTINVGREIGEPISFFLLKDNKIVGRSCNESGRLFFSDVNQDSLKWIPFFPKTYKTGMELFNLYTGDVKISPNLKYIVYPLSHFKEIDIFSCKGSLIHSLIFNNRVQHPDLKVSRNNQLPENFRLYYTSTALNDSNIFVVNSNTTLAKDISGSENPNKQIEVYDYRGNAKFKYFIDKQIGSIAIDGMGEYLYATTPFLIKGDDRSEAKTTFSNTKGGIIRFKVK